MQLFSLKYMTLKIGQIVKNLITSESVVINQIQDLGQMISVTYAGVNSNLSSNKVITKDIFENLEIVTSKGLFNFTGDPKRFALFFA